jgi:hypothetical protein
MLQLKEEAFSVINFFLTLVNRLNLREVY